MEKNKGDSMLNYSRSVALFFKRGVLCLKPRDKSNLNPDAPWILTMNPFFNKFGWTVYWDYQYVQDKLVKSKTVWVKNRS